MLAIRRRKHRTANKMSARLDSQRAPKRAPAGKTGASAKAVAHTGDGTLKAIYNSVTVIVRAGTRPDGRAVLCSVRNRIDPSGFWKITVRPETVRAGTDPARGLAEPFQFQITDTSEHVRAEAYVVTAPGGSESGTHLDTFLTTLSLYHDGVVLETAWGRAHGMKGSGAGDAPTRPGGFVKRGRVRPDIDRPVSTTDCAQVGNPGEPDVPRHVDRRIGPDGKELSIPPARTGIPWGSDPNPNMPDLETIIRLATADDVPLEIAALARQHLADRAAARTHEHVMRELHAPRVARTAPARTEIDDPSGPLPIQSAPMPTAGCRCKGRDGRPAKACLGCNR